MFDARNVTWYDYTVANLGIADLSKGGVYFIRTPEGDPVYVGRGKQIRERLLAHLDLDSDEKADQCIQEFWLSGLQFSYRLVSAEQDQKLVEARYLRAYREFLPCNTQFPAR